MSDISLPGGRAGLPAFDFVANEGPPSLLTRIAHYFVWSEPPAPGSRGEDAASVFDVAAPPVPEAASLPDAAPFTDAAPESDASPCPAPPVAHEAGPTAPTLAKPVKISWWSVQAARLRLIGRVLLAVGRVLRRLCGFFGPRIWRIYRRWPATALGATAAFGLTCFALVPILGPDRMAGAAARLVPGAEFRGWVQIIKPTHVFSLEAPDLGEAAFGYEASRYGVGGGRKDILTFGEFGGTEHPWLRLRLYRRGPEPEMEVEEDIETTLADLLRKESIELVSSEPLDDASTRFGPMSTLRTVLARGGETAQTLDCLGFHIAVRSPGLRIEGLACETPDRLVKTSALECLVDRLDLLAGASDDDLRMFFARAEPMRRRECGRPGARPLAEIGPRGGSVGAGSLRPKRATRLKNVISPRLSAAVDGKPNPPLSVVGMTKTRRDAGSATGEEMMKFANAIGLAAGAMAGLTLFAAAAEAQSRARAPLAPPLTIQRRSFLDPGPVVPVGSMSNYMTANTSLHVPVYNISNPGAFGAQTLPRRFDPPGRPQPLVEFSTGSGGR